jgi:3-oxoacyl-[acyl-carrier-protein] synthase II
LGTTDVGGNAAKIAYRSYCLGEAIDASLARASFNGLLCEEIAKDLGIQVQGVTLGNASAASAVAIGFGRDLLASQDYDLVICAGGDVITESAFQGLFSLRTLAPEGCRPFHPQRRGIRISEAAGVIVLERRSSAYQRAASVLGRIPGYGASHISENPVRPDPNGIAHAVKLALEESRLDLQEVGYINLHGAGTIHGDLAEIQGLEKVFGSKLKQVPLSSTKATLGHCQGAAGILETLVVLFSIQNQALPPTAELNEIGPEFEHLYLFGKSLSVPHLKNGISISCGLGGTNTAILVGGEF